MIRSAVSLALLLAALPAAAAPLDATVFQGKRVSYHVFPPAPFREDEDDKIKIGAGDRPFGQVLAKGGAPIPPLADPAPLVGANLAASLAAHGAVPAQGPNPDFELHVRTYTWGFKPHTRMPGRFYLHQGVEVKLVRSSDRHVVLERRCHPDTRRHPNAPTLDRLRADQARLVRSTSTHLAWRCVQDVAQEAFGIGAEQLPPMPAQFVDPLTKRDIALPPATLRDPAMALADAPARAPAWR